MESFGLILGHLIGDYIVQNDWMAANKTNPHPGLDRPTSVVSCYGDGGGWSYTVPGTDEDAAQWDKDYKAWWIGNLACTVHCLLYTLSVWACSFWWLPLWVLPVIYLAHWPVDRWRLAGRWMRNLAGQKAFASGPLSPWSVIVVDNTIHLIVLWAIGVAVLAAR